MVFDFFVILNSLKKLIIAHVVQIDLTFEILNESIGIQTIVR